MFVRIYVSMHGATPVYIHACIHTYVLYTYAFVFRNITIFCIMWMLKLLFLTKNSMC